MDIDKLRTFIDLAKTLSFSETAQNLYTSQSTVSKQIKALERELGLVLFDRTNKKVVLSEYGKSILNSANEIVTLEDKILLQTHNYKMNNQSQISLGTIPTFSYNSIFAKTMLYQKEHPEMNLTLQELESKDLFTLLDEGKLDLAFARSLDIDNLNYEKILIDTESFTVCLSKDHPLAKKEIVHLADLKDEKFIMLSNSSLLYQPVIELCKKAGFAPNISFVGDRMSSILQIVRSGQGISILMHPEEKEQNLVFKKLNPTMTSYLLFIRTKSKHSQVNNDFWKYLKQFDNSKTRN